MSVPVLADRVSKRFADTVALDAVSMEVRSGEILGLLGPNGAGKTTLIRTILDIIKPDSGRVELFGHRFQPGDRDRIGYLPEERGLYPRQPVGAVLQYLGALKGLSPADARTQTAAWLDRFDLSDAADKKVEQLSKGNQQILTTSSSSRAARSAPIGVVDKAGILDIAFAAEQAAARDRVRSGDSFAGLAASLTPTGGLSGYTDESRALDDLASGFVSSVYVIEANYLATGSITAYAKETSVLGQATANQRLAIVTDAIRASLLKTTVSGDVLARAYAPGILLTRKLVDNTGGIHDAGNDFGFGRFTGTFGVFILLTMSIFFSAGFLQQATIEDRQNRVFEVLVSSVDAGALILGKIIGLGGAGLLQMAFYIALILAGSTALPFLDISAGRLALSIVYFVMGYLLFASLMAAVGMIARTAQESAQLSAVWTLSSIAPIFFITSIVSSPNGLISRVLSFFPLSSAVTMLLRLTTNDVPTIDLVVSMLIGVASVYAALRGTVRIFRAATLMYGKRPSLPELLRWLRAA